MESVNFDQAAGSPWRAPTSPGGMLRRLAANAGGSSPVPLAQADATRLPFAAGAFGSVLAVHVLHLIPDWRVAVDETVRVVLRPGRRPGGVLPHRQPGRRRR